MVIRDSCNILVFMVGDVATLKFNFSLFMKIYFCMTNFTVSLFVLFFYFLLLAPILCMGKMDPN